MATQKQLAARRKFVAAVKAGKFRKKKKAVKKRPTKKKAVKKKAAKKRPAKKKAAKKRVTKSKLRKALKVQGLKMPHGYELAMRKKKPAKNSSHYRM